MPKALADCLTQASLGAPKPQVLLSRLSPHTPAPPPEVSAALLPLKPEFTLPKRNLRDRIADPEFQRPLLDCIDLQFHRKTDLQARVLENKTFAVITRLQPLFDRKAQLNTLRPRERIALDLLVDRLNFIVDHIDEIVDTFPVSSKYQINYVLKAIGQISFKNLKLNYMSIIHQLLEIEFQKGWANGLDTALGI